ncbi:hypothetical protein ACFPRL_17305 [Pseudoclavibacter helvolus]
MPSDRLASFCDAWRASAKAVSASLSCDAGVCSTVGVAPGCAARL